MAQVTATSHAGRVPATDGRSAEARLLKSVRAELVAQIGDPPTASQALLIDRVAQVSLRINALDRDPALADGGEYLALTRLLADLLVQLQPAVLATSIMPCPQREAAA